MISVKGAKIEGVVACVPANSVDNIESLTPLYQKEAENIVRATGIKSRRICPNGTSTLELFFQAAKQLLDKTATPPAEIGAVIAVTFTPKYRMPFNSTLLQNALGLDHSVLAFDLNLACSGYAYGLYTASLIAESTGKKVLLLDGDVQSAFTSPYDKGTLPVLADAGTATLVAPGGSDEWLFDFYTDGAKGDNLKVEAGGSSRRLEVSDLAYQELPDGSKLRNTDIYMNGFEIFKFVASDVVKLLKKNWAEYAGIRAFVPHQANMYMIKQLARSAGIDPEIMWKSGDVFGNPSSASVPLTIAYQANAMLRDDKTKALLCGFGGGLSAAVGVVELYRDAVYAVTELKE